LAVQPIGVKADGCAENPDLASLRDSVGAHVVGDCSDDISEDPNGDIRVRTGHGELVLRAADGTSAFTNGFETWVKGPFGLQQRPNGQTFVWEPAAPGAPRSGAILPRERIVAYYGNPLSGQMGILGELPPESLSRRLRDQAAEYARVDQGRPVRTALELIAVVAQAGPGADGLYRLRMDTELIEDVARWADEAGHLLILDVQPGRADMVAEAEWLQPFLKRPNVHLALDSEFAMRGNQLPGKNLGSMDAAVVNRTVQMLAELVTSWGLPPKVLIVHRFEESMLTNHHNILVDPRVQVVMDMDGFGAPAVKVGGYGRYVREAHAQYAGFKLFYRQDVPLMSPEDVLGLDPIPDVVIYQ
jgi:hypothetical protein